MEWSINLGYLAMILLLGGLIRLGGRSLGGSGGEPVRNPPRWPSAALVIPVAGASPRLADNLRSRLVQDYPDYQVILVTAGAEDPAVPVIQGLMADHPRLRHVVSGPAQKCSQKNLNLLAGLQMVGDPVEVFVFADANQEAPPHWLRELVRPLALGEAEVASGYHQVRPETSALAAVGRSVTVLLLCLLRSIPWGAQPWGGATAITRECFTRLELDRWWEHQIVDDVSLARRLTERKARLAITHRVLLTTPLEHCTISDWVAWHIRQWIYLKFCLWGQWAVSGLMVLGIAGMLLWAGARLLLTLGGWVPLAEGAAASLFLALVTVLAASLRRLHPWPGPALKWVAAVYLAILMGAWCHIRTWFTQTLQWCGLTYRVGPQGRVTGIQRPGEEWQG